MTLQEDLVAIGGLSNPSKMPGYGWSISAHDCLVGTRLRETPGSVCSNCYALKGRYLFSGVHAAHVRRKKALYTDGFVPAFIRVLMYKYKRNPDKYSWFRWHDSGDIQDMVHLDKIVQIAKGTPPISHWLPTREVGIVGQYIKYHSEKAIPPNLAIRISHPMIGGTYKTKPSGIAYSTVSAVDPNVKDCPASKQGNVCGDCRMCWDKDTNINYKEH